MADLFKPRVQKTSLRSRLVTAISNNPDLVAIVLFCVIGLSVTLNMILRFPDLGGIIAQFNQF
ncbi:MAG: hypothetical protein WAM40_04160 [Xanthobacteraceae bacterium]